MMAMSVVWVIVAAITWVLFQFGMPAPAKSEYGYAAFRRGYSERQRLKFLLVVLFVQLVGAGSAAAICYGIAIDDEQVINSKVVSKTRDRVSCRHSYECNCHQSCSGSGKNRSCSQVCDTCYEHSYDVDWNVRNAIGTTWSIDTIDRQGLQEPPRWSRVVLGEPTAETRHYTNYVKASPDSLFRTQGARKSSVPKYPIQTYDYWHVDRLVETNVPVPDADQWNRDLAALNAEVGPAKQANAVVVLTSGKDHDWFYSLRQQWIGAKKNDVVLVIDMDRDRRPVWVDVMSWELNQELPVKLRDAVMALPVIDREPVLMELKNAILQFHQRKRMHDFEYLSASIVPSGLQIGLTFVILLAAGVAAFALARNQ